MDDCGISGLTILALIPLLGVGTAGAVWLIDSYLGGAIFETSTGYDYENLVYVGLAIIGILLVLGFLFRRRD